MTAAYFSRAAAAALAVVCGCAMSGCLGSDEEEPTGERADGGSPASMPAVPEAILDQKLTWKKCKDLQCASIKVPIDYADPGTGTTVIKMARFPAQGEKSMGPLLLNPGGPGGSGIEEVEGKGAIATLKPSPLTKNYDLVGFDPRGVVSSSPVRCLGPKALDEFWATDVSPATDEEKQELRQGYVRMGEACGKDPLARHVSTVEVARDMDVMRHVLGVEKLDYLGSSYGTRLGATYAALYPDRVGRMVLDGALDPNSTNEDLILEQVRGFERAFDDWAKDCADGGKCPLGDDADQVKKTVSDVLESLQEKPLPTSDPNYPLTQALGLSGVISPVYAQEGWPGLTASLVAARKGRGQPLLESSSADTGRSEDGYANNGSQMREAVNCLDVQLTGIGDGPSAEELAEAAPTLGPFYGLDSESTCGAWPLKPTVEKPDFSAEGAAPIVVIGTTRDPATPYEWAEKMADTLDSGVLLTREGEGHTGFEVGNDCIDKIIYDYFVDGTLPQDGKRCADEAGDDRADKHPRGR